MCGIAGVLSFEPAAPGFAKAALEPMIGAMAHRGPDAEGIWTATTRTGGTIALGHRRLQIIDLSPGGRQPMTRGPLTISYNGEIGNYKDLRNELAADGAEFRTTSDTEVLLAAWERWGVAATDRLVGMFAFSIWDARDERLWLVRDRFGIKPLYVARAPKCVAFASEIRALLASGLVDARLNRQSLWHYLGYQTAPTPATLISGIDLIEPGCVMTIDGQGRTGTRRYWSLLAAARDADSASTKAAALEDIKERLRGAVQTHIASDVPVGVFLSGGIDSGAIVSVMADAGVRARTFTITLGDSSAGNEASEARATAKTFGAEHTEIQLQADALLAMMPDALAAVDHPSGDGINAFVVSRAVRAHGLTVALSGLGGDEIFGGYPSFRRLARIGPAARTLGRSPASLKKTAAQVLRSAGGGRVVAEKGASALETGGSIAELWPITRELFPARERERLLGGPSQEGRRDIYGDLLAAAFADAPDADVYGQVSYAESRAYMHDVLLRDTDQMSMAHGLEVRVPLLDHRLAAYVVALPAAWKLAGHKSLLVSSLPRPLPSTVIGKPKRGFALPFDEWMRGPLRVFCEQQLGPDGLDGRGMFAPGALTELWRRFLSRRPGATWPRLWSLVALNAWLERQRVLVS